jgi:hypothetical protein
MTWYFDTNNTHTQSAESIFALKELLKGTPGWSVKSSGDASTYNSTGDQISHDGSGANGMDNSKAWFRIQMPTAQSVTREFTFQRGTSDYQCRIKYSYSAGFTGGSPDATTTPSATDEQILWGSGTDAAPGFSTLFPSSGTWMYNCCAGNSSEGYAFYGIAIPQGGGSTVHYIIWEALLDNSYPSEDVDPYIIIMEDIAMTLSSLSSSSASPVRGYLAKGLPAEDWVMIPALSHEDTGSNIEQALSVNPHTGKDDALPIMYARRAAFAAPTGYKGVGRMMKWIGTYRYTATTLTISSSKDRIVFDAVSLPWDGSNPII